MASARRDEPEMYDLTLLTISIKPLDYSSVYDSLKVITLINIFENYISMEKTEGYFH